MDRVAAAHQPRRPVPPAERLRREQPSRILFEELECRGSRQQFRADHFDRRTVDIGLDRGEEIVGPRGDQLAEASNRPEPFADSQALPG